MEKGFISKLFLIILLGFVILLLWVLGTYISAIVLAFLISSAFYPLFSWLKKRLRGSNRNTALIMIIFIFFILVIPVGGFIGTLSNEALDFYSRTRNIVSIQKINNFIQGDSIWAQRIQRVEKLANIELDTSKIEEFASSIGRNLGLYLAKQLNSIASNLLDFLVHFFLMMMIIYYIYRDGERLKNYIFELLPFPDKQQELVMDKFREMGRAVIFGNGLSGIIQGILGGFGFFFFGLGSPVLWGTVMGFMAFLPIIGASIIFIPGTIVLIVQGKIGMAFGYLAYNVAYSSTIEYLIKPRLIGKGMHMNQILVFIGILGGLKLFGILGIIYGPLIITIFFTLAEIYRLEYSETKT